MLVHLLTLWVTRHDSTLKRQQRIPAGVMLKLKNKTQINIPNMKRITFTSIFLFLTWISYSQEFSSLTVEGKAIIKEVPENVLITINLISSDPDYIICSDKLTNNSNNLQKDLINQGIDSKIIKANNFRIEENNQYQNGGLKKLGYNGLIELTIESKYSNQLLSIIMEVLKKNEYKFSYSVQFILSELQKQVLINYAIENAITDAKTKAEIIAKAANIELFKIKSIIYTNEFKYYNFDSDVFDRVYYRPPPPMLAQIVKPASDDSNGITINQKELAVEKLVTVEWITKVK
jgi:uncharacterized protein YggE